MKKIVITSSYILITVIAVITMNSISTTNSNHDLLSVKNMAFATGEENKGLLYGNEGGTGFCCCPGENDCFASSCPTYICD